MDHVGWHIEISVNGEWLLFEMTHDEQKKNILTEGLSNQGHSVRVLPLYIDRGEVKLIHE